MSLDPLAKAVSAIKRELRRIVEGIEPQDRTMILDLAQREVDKLRSENNAGK